MHWNWLVGSFWNKKNISSSIWIVCLVEKFNRIFQKNHYIFLLWKMISTDVKCSNFVQMETISCGGTLWTFLIHLSFFYDDLTSDYIVYNTRRVRNGCDMMTFTKKLSRIATCWFFFLTYYSTATLSRPVARFCALSIDSLQIVWQVPGKVRLKYASFSGAGECATAHAEQAI